MHLLMKQVLFLVTLVAASWSVAQEALAETATLQIVNESPRETLAVSEFYEDTLRPFYEDTLRHFYGETIQPWVDEFISLPWDEWWKFFQQNTFKISLEQWALAAIVILVIALVYFRQRRKLPKYGRKLRKNIEEMRKDAPYKKKL
tara:strand:+ start:337 stop:774 length:438 start_codon:yes stop_codon:yes gene_type:complete